MHSIGEKIKNAREVKNLTQVYMAKKLNISQRAFSKIENNEVNLVVNKLMDIAKILGVSPSEFLPNDGTHLYNNIVSTQKGNRCVINQAERSIVLYEKLLHYKDELLLAKENQIKQLQNQLEKIKK